MTLEGVRFRHSCPTCGRIEVPVSALTLVEDDDPTHPTFVVVDHSDDHGPTVVVAGPGTLRTVLAYLGAKVIPFAGLDQINAEALVLALEYGEEKP